MIQFSTAKCVTLNIIINQSFESNYLGTQAIILLNKGATLSFKIKKLFSPRIKMKAVFIANHTKFLRLRERGVLFLT